MEKVDLLMLMNGTMKGSSKISKQKGKAPLFFKKMDISIKVNGLETYRTELANKCGKMQMGHLFIKGNF